MFELIMMLHMLRSLRIVSNVYTGQLSCCLIPEQLVTGVPLLYVMFVLLVVRAVHGQPAGGFMSLMSGPSYGLTQMPTDKERRINVRFEDPLHDEWGQTLALTGTGAASGDATQHIVDTYRLCLLGHPNNSLSCKYAVAARGQ